ncbi:MAG: 4'-phosphopantetheinyl transferase superfamily protein [Bacteroidota bacterium]
MPLIETTRLNKTTRYGIWRISESTSALKNAYSQFLPDEPYILTIKNKHRVKESLAARLTLKYLLEYEEIEFDGVRRDEFNKPHLIGYDSLYISLAHSFPYAVAIFNKAKPTGIDIEEVSDRPATIAHKFLNYNELLNASDDAEMLTAYWTIKETLYKAYGKRKLIFKDNLIIEPFRLGSIGKTKGMIKTSEKEDIQKIHLKKHDNFILSCNY